VVDAPARRRPCRDAHGSGAGLTVAVVAASVRSVRTHRRRPRCGVRAPRDGGPARDEVLAHGGSLGARCSDGDVFEGCRDDVVLLGFGVRRLRWLRAAVFA